MLNEIVSFPAADGHLLDALLYEPSRRGSVALVLTHGRAMDFCIGPPRFLPPVLLPFGYTCLAINRRGAGALAMGGRHGPRGGAALEVFGDSQLDLAGAVDFLRGRGYDSIGLIGHSYGSGASGYYASNHPEIAALVLLSGAIGGPDHLRQMCERGMLAQDRYDEFEAEARHLVAEGRGEELMFFPGWFHLSTARAFVEHGMPYAPDWIRQVRCPVLALRGELENPEQSPVERYAELAPGGGTAVVIPGSDHFYGGHEAEVGRAVADWLQAHLPAGGRRDTEGPTA